jgi:hypothetical protein
MSHWKHPNIGGADRLLRALLGLAGIALVVTGPHTAWGYLGFIPLITAAVGFCPLYALLGLDTRGRRVR